jgi:hypothetical protein
MPPVLLEPMQIRRATLDDLTAITDVVLASLAEDSSWKNLFISDIRNDPDCHFYVKESLRRYLDLEELVWLVLVAEVAHGGKFTIASVAIWNISLDRYQNPRRDCRSKRVNSVQWREL